MHRMRSMWERELNHLEWGFEAQIRFSPKRMVWQFIRDPRDTEPNAKNTNIYMHSTQHRQRTFGNVMICECMYARNAACLHATVCCGGGVHCVVGLCILYVNNKWKIERAPTRRTSNASAPLHMYYTI